MTQFEVPYNFDPDFINVFHRNERLVKYIKFIYIPAYKDDCRTTREHIYFSETYPKTWEAYLEHVRRLQALNVPLCVLMQRNATLEVFDKYYNLGFRYFILNDDELAKTIRKDLDSRLKYSGAVLILSITRTLTFEQIKDEKNDYSMYDYIVLFFWFARHLEAIEELPRKYKYILICNANCYYNCIMHDRHWFVDHATTAEEHQKEFGECCSHCGRYTGTNHQMEVDIFPSDLHYFEPYISHFKLVDRVYDSEKIFRELDRFCPHDKKYYMVDDSQVVNQDMIQCEGSYKIPDMLMRHFIGDNVHVEIAIHRMPDDIIEKVTGYIVSRNDDLIDVHRTDLPGYGSMVELSTICKFTQVPDPTKE